MVFTSPSGAVPLPYPTALPGTSCSVQYPVSGSHITNPEGHSRQTLKTRPGHIKNNHFHSYWLPNGYLGPPLGTSVIQYDHQIQAWLATWWKNTLTPTQRLAWDGFAYYHPVPDMFGKTRTLSGWGFFLHANRTYIGLAHGAPQPAPFPISFWNYVTPWGQTPFFTDPPPQWPAITAQALSNFLPYILPTSLTHAPLPWLYLIWTGPASPITSNLCTLMYLSRRPKGLTGPRQGSIVQIGATLSTTIFDTLNSMVSPINPTNLAPDQRFTLVYQTLDYIGFGESPLTWTQITTLPYPAP